MTFECPNCGSTMHWWSTAQFCWSCGDKFTWEWNGAALFRPFDFPVAGNSGCLSIII
jgi:hypothetical protein